MGLFFLLKWNRKICFPGALYVVERERPLRPESDRNICPEKWSRSQFWPHLTYWSNLTTARNVFFSSPNVGFHYYYEQPILFFFFKISPNAGDLSLKHFCQGGCNCCQNFPSTDEKYNCFPFLKKIRHEVLLCWLDYILGWLSDNPFVLEIWPATSINFLSTLPTPWSWKTAQRHFTFHSHILFKG